jgi:hypothetical protein
MNKKLKTKNVMTDGNTERPTQETRQALMRLVLNTGNNPKDNTNGNLPDHMINQWRK